MCEREIRERSGVLGGGGGEIETRRVKKCVNRIAHLTVAVGVLDYEIVGHLE